MIVFSAFVKVSRYYVYDDCISNLTVYLFVCTNLLYLDILFVDFLLLFCCFCSCCEALCLRSRNKSDIDKSKDRKFKIDSKMHEQSHLH